MKTTIIKLGELMEEKEDKSTLENVLFFENGKVVFAPFRLRIEMENVESEIYYGNVSYVYTTDEDFVIVFEYDEIYIKTNAKEKLLNEFLERVEPNKMYEAYDVRLWGKENVIVSFFDDKRVSRNVKIGKNVWEKFIKEIEKIFER